MSCVQLVAEPKHRREQAGSLPLSHDLPRSLFSLPGDLHGVGQGVHTPVFLPRSAKIPGIWAQIETMRKYHVLGFTTFTLY